MIRIRPFKLSDTEKVLSWCTDEKSFYQWSAGRLGDYPPPREAFSRLHDLMQFTALDEKELVGYFTVRNPKDTLDELRFGYIILDPDKRGKGYGKAMLQLGLKYAFEIYKAVTVTLGVFENNPSAYHCYKAVGFTDADESLNEIYSLMGEDWLCKELIIRKEQAE